MEKALDFSTMKVLHICETCKTKFESKMLYSSNCDSCKSK